MINIRDNNLMSSLQKYMRTKKKTVNCITTVDPFLLGGGINTAEGKVKGQITPFTGGWCALHTDVTRKGVKFTKCIPEIVSSYFL